MQSTWSDISPDLKSIKDVLEPLKSFIQASHSSNDIVLIQGDFGAVYEMVNFCKALDLVCVYATTKRIVIEHENEDRQSIKKSIFEHRRFREYGI
jgi:hypothetical protein